MWSSSGRTMNAGSVTMPPRTLEYMAWKLTALACTACRRRALASSGVKTGVDPTVGICDPPLYAHRGIEALPTLYSTPPWNAKLACLRSDQARSEKNVRIFAQATTNCQTLTLSFHIDHDTIARTRKYASGKRGPESVRAPQDRVVSTQLPIKQPSSA